jgi:hypothetical protein
MILLPRFQVLPIEAPAERLEAENKTRQTLAQVIGGLMLLGGAFVGWKQFENQRAQLTEQRRQFEVQTALQRNQAEEQRRQYESQADAQRRQAASQQQQIDAQARDAHRRFQQQERQLADQREQFHMQYEASRQENTAEQFRRTVEQLSSDVAETRLAALHALEKLARSSPSDQWAILGILTALIRHRAPSPGPLPDDDPAVGLFPKFGFGPAVSLVGPSADVQRALSIVALNTWTPPTARPEQMPDEKEWEFLRRLETHNRTYRVNLSKVDLRGVVLTGARLDGVDLSGSCLVLANLDGASLRHANLAGVDARNASFGGADLRNAKLTKVNAVYAAFWNAQMQQADMTDANFVEAALGSARLQGARLWGAAFGGNDLGPGRTRRLDVFRGALIDSRTKGIDEDTRAFLEAENPQNKAVGPNRP